MGSGKEAKLLALIKKRIFINKRNSFCLVPCRVCGFRYHILGIAFRRAYACWVFPLASFVLPLCRVFFCCCCCFYFISCLFFFCMLFVSFCNNTRSALSCSLALTPSASHPLGYSLATSACLPALATLFLCPRPLPALSLFCCY